MKRYLPQILALQFVIFLSGTMLSAVSLAAPPAWTPLSTSCASGDVNGNGTTDYDDVTLNEIKSKGGGPAPTVEYIEAKILTPDVDIDGWQVCFSSDPTKESCTTMGAGNGTWYTASQVTGLDDDSGPDAANPTTYQTNTWITYPATNVKADEGESILFDSSGNVIDYIRWSNNAGACSNDDKHWDVASDCGACFDNRDPSQQDFARVPDGGGDFGNNGDSPSEGSSNDPIVTPTGPDHYAISYPLGNPGVTCEALAVQVTAHDNADAAFVPAAGTTITLSTNPAADGWALKAGNGVFTAPNQYAFDGVETSVQFWLTETTVTTTPHIDIDVGDGSAFDLDGNATEDANAEFTDATLRFFAGDGVTQTPESIGTQIAGKSSSTAPGNQTLQLRAVQTSTTTGACEAALQGTTPINLGYECNNPASCTTTGDLVTVSAAETSTIARNNNGAVGSYTSVNMTFDANGIASFSVSYSDAGQITLHANKTLSAGIGTPPSTALTLTGASNAFVVRPFGFGITNIQQGATVNPEGTASTGSAFIAAGDVFEATVGAFLWDSSEDADNDGVPDPGVDISDNGLTPNFSADVSLSVATGSITPAGGVGNLAGTTTLLAADFSGGTAGVTSSNDLTFSDVGSFQLQADTINYLNSGSDVTGLSADIGRFYPDHFTLTASTVTPACVAGGFSYMDQAEMTVQYTVEARNAGNSKTSNYADPGYGFLGAVSMVAEDSDDGIDLGGRLSPGSIPTWSLGSYVFSSTLVAFTREATGVLDGSFDNLQLGINVLSHASDPVATLDALDMNAATTGACVPCDAQEIGGSVTKVRFGRLAMQSAFGSELIDLPVAFGAEYYDGAGFVTHTDDVCTSLNQADHLRLSNADTSGGALQSGDTPMTVGGGSSNIISFNSPLLAGDVGLIFSAPGEGNTGDIEVLANIDCSDATIACVTTDIFPYLLFDWDNDGLHDDNPKANVSFGIFSRSDNIIYTREPW